MLARWPDGATDKKAIVIVDDHPLMRRGLISLIGDEPDLMVCAEAKDRQAALLVVARQPPDLVIVDLALKGGADGLDVVRALKVTHPAIPVLVLSMHPESLYAERALRAGAQGYLNKQQLGDTVLVAIRRLLEGRIYVSEALGMTLAAHVVRGAGKSASPLGSLSDRELQVFGFIGNGRRTREIAEMLKSQPEDHRDLPGAYQAQARPRHRLRPASARRSLCRLRGMTPRQPATLFADAAA